MSVEMAFDIKSTTRELLRAGMCHTNAQLEARRRFGRVLKQKGAGHGVRTRGFFDDLRGYVPPSLEQAC